MVDGSTILRVSKSALQCSQSSTPSCFVPRFEGSRSLLASKRGLYFYTIVLSSKRVGMIHATSAWGCRKVCVQACKDFCVEHQKLQGRPKMNHCGCGSKHSKTCPRKPVEARPTLGTSLAPALHFGSSAVRNIRAENCPGISLSSS